MANSTSRFLRQKEELLEFLEGIDYDARRTSLTNAVKEGKAGSAVEELRKLDDLVSVRLERRIRIPFMDDKIDVYLAKVEGLKRDFWTAVNSELAQSKNSFEQLYKNIHRKDPNLQKSIAELRKLSESAVALEQLVGQNSPLVRKYAEYSGDLRVVDKQLERVRDEYASEQIAPEEAIKQISDLEIVYERVNSAHQPNILFKHPAYKYFNPLVTRLRREVALHKRRNLPGIRSQIKQDISEMSGVLQNLNSAGDDYFAVLQKVENLPVSKNKFSRWKKFSFLAQDVSAYESAFEEYSGMLEQNAQEQAKALSEDIARISADNFATPSEGMAYIIKFRQNAKKALGVLGAFSHRAKEASEQLSVLDYVMLELQSRARSRGERVLRDYSFSFVEAVSDAPLPSNHPLQEIRTVLIGDTHNGNLPDRILYTKTLLDKPIFGDSLGRQFLEKYRTALVSSMNQGYLAFAFDNNLVSRESFNELLSTLDNRIAELTK